MKFWNVVEILEFCRNYGILSKFWKLVEILEFVKQKLKFGNILEFGKKFEIREKCKIWSKL